LTAARTGLGAGATDASGTSQLSLAVTLPATQTHSIFW
jgi:hypothetical protein